MLELGKEAWWRNQEMEVLVLARGHLQFRLNQMFYTGNISPWGNRMGERERAGKPSHAEHRDQKRGRSHRPKLVGEILKTKKRSWLRHSVSDEAGLEPLLEHIRPGIVVLLRVILISRPLANDSFEVITFPASSTGSSLSLHILVRNVYRRLAPAQPKDVLGGSKNVFARDYRLLSATRNLQPVRIPPVLLFKATKFRFINSISDK
ncbi:hypothetical protein KQX54_019221 [Cotesia glomerata]|uniref:Uncharacterized protein n=1 Tax=Cotesia glomerata TaxID=32391 RepID=A0AAV7IBF4_COTGL|nr:hypothetical protein KQX54_019221 [Cotesia glomerata]